MLEVEIMSNDSIRILTFGNDCLIVNLNSLDHITVKRSDLTVDFIKSLLEQNILSDVPYTERLKPLEISPIVRPTIVPSFACNYSCSYCYQVDYKGEHSEMTEYDVDLIYKFCIEFCQQNNSPLIFGDVDIIGGEPLLPRNSNVIRKVLQSWPDSTFTVTTNGTYINEYIDMFCGHNIRMKVSLDGTKDIHMRRRHTQQSDAYEHSIEGVIQLLDHKIPTVIVAVFNPEYISEYSRFFDLLETLGWLTNPLLNCAFIPEVDCGCEGITRNSIMRNINSLFALKKIDARVNHVDTRKLIPGTVELYDALFLAKKGFYKPYRCAALAGYMLTFLPNGDVKPCLAIPDEIGCIGHFRNGITIDRKKINMLQSRRIDVFEKCKSCSMKAFCGGGCLATVAKKTGTLLGYNCEFWDDPIFLNYL